MNNLNRNVLNLWRPFYLSSTTVFLIKQRPSPAGIWPTGWDGQRGICDWEGLSLTTKDPQTGEKGNQSASDLDSQTHQQLEKREIHNVSYTKWHKVKKNSHSELLQVLTFRTSIAFWGVEDVVNCMAHFRVQGGDFWIARAWENVLIDRLQVQPMTDSVSETVKP